MGFLCSFFALCRSTSLQMTATTAFWWVFPGSLLLKQCAFKTKMLMRCLVALERPRQRVRESKDRLIYKYISFIRFSMASTNRMGLCLWRANSWASCSHIMRFEGTWKINLEAQSAFVVWRLTHNLKFVHAFTISAHSAVGFKGSWDCQEIGRRCGSKLTFRAASHKNVDQSGQAWFHWSVIKLDIGELEYRLCVQLRSCKPGTKPAHFIWCQCKDIHS